MMTASWMPYQWILRHEKTVGRTDGPGILDSAVFPQTVRHFPVIASEWIRVTLHFISHQFRKFLAIRLYLPDYLVSTQLAQIGMGDAMSGHFMIFVYLLDLVTGDLIMPNILPYAGDAMDLPQKSGIEVKGTFNSKTVKKSNQLFILFDSIIVTKCKKFFKQHNPSSLQSDITLFGDQLP